MVHQNPINSPSQIGKSKPIFTDNVLPWLLAGREQGEKGALVTFVACEGTAPRPIGAQMAVRESGLSQGLIASDCLGEAIVQEAIKTIEKKAPTMVRYGKGSPYIDLKLPCGSGIDLYFNSTLEDDILAQMVAWQKKRKTFTAQFDIKQGTTSLSPYAPNQQSGFLEKDVTQFVRTYLPTPRLIIIGSGPNILYLANFAQQSGFEVQVISPDKEIIEQPQQFTTHPLQELKTVIEHEADPYTAAVVLFHDHDLEPPVLKHLLNSRCFYIGAMGSKRAHQARLEVLQNEGTSTSDLRRLKGPIGALPAAKNPPQLAISILAELMQEAQKRNLIC